MRRRLFQGILAVCFLAVLIVPLVASDFAGGGLSESENRQLAAFPDVLDSDGRLSPDFKTGFEEWLQDNVGFRSDFVKLAAYVKYKLFRQSATPRVVIGRDGWLYFSDADHVALSMGSYSISDERLEEIALRQQHLSDAYASQGIRYLFVLVPMKTTVYPEFMPSWNGESGELLIDRVEAYLKEHTSVELLNTKHTLFARKPEEMLYLKTDSHWNQLGSYRVYQAVAERLERMGFHMKEFPVSFSTQEFMGNLTEILNATRIFGEETTPLAQWETSSTELTEGEIYDAIKYSSFSIALSNPNAPNGTLLIYGDSYWRRERALPQLLCESFRTVVHVDYRATNGKTDERLEALIHPDAVIFGIEESAFPSFEMFSCLPWPVDALPELAWRERTPEEAANAGLRVQIEKTNDESAPNQEAIVVPDGARTLVLEGWAADMAAGKRLTDLYVQAGDRLFRCDYRIARDDVPGNDQAMKKTGFMAVVPAEALREGRAAEITFIAVNADGQSMSVAAAYPLVWDASGE